MNGRCEVAIEITVALIGFLGTLSASAIGYAASRKSRRRANQAEAEMRFQQAALDFGAFVGEWDETHAQLVRLMSDTAVDRFLILRAWNGAADPRWTTAVYQLRIGEQQPMSYVHFELDPDYVSRLQSIKGGRPLVFSTVDLPDSAIKRVYQAEKVSASAWFHLQSLKLVRSEARAVTYCSFSTHEPGGLSEEDVTRCRIIVGRLKGLAGMFTVDGV